MIVLPSIAFGGFSGSAKDVTARHVNGRSILTVRSWPTGQTTNAQVVRRASMSKITKSYQHLTDAQMQDWERLASHTSGSSVFGQKAQLSGINLYVRLNANRVMAGEAMILDAPEVVSSVPDVELSQVAVTPELVTLNGIMHQPRPYKLVVKMSGSQSAGISNGWSKTVIVSPGMEDDWGEANVTTLYLKTFGVMPTVGQKVFVETYWMDTSTGFVGQSVKVSVIVTGEAPASARIHITGQDLDPEKEQHVSSLDVDFSTNSPCVYCDTVCEGESGVASSTANLDKLLPEDCVGFSMLFARGMGEDGSLHPQSFQIHSYNSITFGKIVIGHVGGKYVKPSEVFGPGIAYSI